MPTTIIKPSFIGPNYVLAGGHSDSLTLYDFATKKIVSVCTIPEEMPISVSCNYCHIGHNVAPEIAITCRSARIYPLNAFFN